MDPDQSFTVLYDHPIFLFLIFHIFRSGHHNEKPALTPGNIVQNLWQHVGQLPSEDQQNILQTLLLLHEQNDEIPGVTIEVVEDHRESLETQTPSCTALPMITDDPPSENDDFKMGTGMILTALFFLII